MGVVRPESVNWKKNHQNTQETAKSELVFRRMLRESAAPVNFLWSFSAAVYVREARELAVPLTAMNVKAGIRVVEQVFHVQNVNAYDSCLKIWVHRIQGKITVHHHYYLGWRRLLDHFCENMDTKILPLADLGINYLQHRTLT